MIARKKPGSLGVMRSPLREEQQMTQMLDSQSVDALEAKLHGGVTQPDDPDYDEVRALYNGMIDKRPALIARCADVEVVLADGSVVQANEKENPDLHWALRGGGGNFGVVTKIEAQLHPCDTVVCGPMFWSLDKAADVMRWYRGFILNAPEELNGFF